MAKYLNVLNITVKLIRLFCYYSNCEPSASILCGNYIIMRILNFTHGSN